MVDIVFQFFSFLGADWIVCLLFLFSIISFAVIIEKFFLLYYERKEFIILIQEMQIGNDNGNFKEKIVRILNSKTYSGSLFNILKATYGKKSYKKEDSWDICMAQENKRLKNRLMILDILGNNSVYLGLLGTVLGIMNAFSKMSHSTDAAAVMDGVSEALSTTALGLLVGVPSVIAFNVFNTSIKNLLLDIDYWIEKKFIPRGNDIFT